jgi:hypothetical protein
MALLKIALTKTRNSNSAKLTRDLKINSVSLLEPAPLEQNEQIYLVILDQDLYHTKSALHPTR